MKKHLLRVAAVCCLPLFGCGDDFPPVTAEVFKSALTDITVEYNSDHERQLVFRFAQSEEVIEIPQEGSTERP